MSSSRTPDAGLSDHALARSLATGAGEVLLEVRAGFASSTPAELKQRGDRAAHEWLMTALSRTRPADAVLSEEATLDEQRRWAAADRSGRVWVIDPLDGTREFSEGRADWAVHVALCVDHTPIAAAVALPSDGITLATDEAIPAVDTRPSRPRLAVSRSRPPAAAQLLAERLDAELVELGSAGYKTMAVVTGAADIYVHSGGQYEWDNCAPVGVARHAGLWTSRVDGSELRYCNDSPRLDDLVVCDLRWRDATLAALAGLA